MKRVMKTQAGELPDFGNPVVSPDPAARDREPARSHNSVSTSTSDLARFVTTAKRNAIPDDALVPLLRHNGWPERLVYETLSGYYGELLGMPPPSRSARADNARDAFYFLLNFITLAFWTTALGQIFYALIEQSFPDSAVSESGELIDHISWQLATLVVAFPSFVAVNGLIERGIRARPELLDSPIRSWLTYLALVIAALIVLSDFIWFVQAFLRGHLTIHFVLDSLVLLTIGGGVFTYYLAGLRRTPERR